MCITDTPKSSSEKVACDTIVPLPCTKLGNEYLLTFQCLFSKFAVTKHILETTAADEADVYFRKVICVFGSPLVLLTDQRSNFLIKLMKRVARRFQIKQFKTTAHQTQTNGS